MINKARKFLLTLPIIGLALYGGFWLAYYFSMQKANREGVKRACEENRKQVFNGVITSINKYEYDSFMNGKFFSIRIEKVDSSNLSFTYLYLLPENEALLKFIEVGQIAVKEFGSDQLQLIDEQKGARQFFIEKCGLVDH